MCGGGVNFRRAINWVSKSYGLRTMQYGTRTRSGLQRGAGNGIDGRNGARREMSGMTRYLHTDCGPRTVGTDCVVWIVGWHRAVDDQLFNALYIY